MLITNPAMVRQLHTAQNVKNAFIGDGVVPDGATALSLPIALDRGASPHSHMLTACVLGKGTYKSRYGIDLSIGYPTAEFSAFMLGDAGSLNDRLRVAKQAEGLLRRQYDFGQISSRLEGITRTATGRKWDEDRKVQAYLTALDEYSAYFGGTHIVIVNAQDMLALRPDLMMAGRMLAGG